MNRGPEVHIAGVLVHARPQQLAEACRGIAALPGAEVSQSAADGRIVVVLEHASGAAVLDAIDAMRALPGVVDVALVYQHAEALDAMDEPIEQETAADERARIR